LKIPHALLVAATLLLAAAPSAYGQATRTWVSGVGDDVNPCSRTAPCKTWAGAISKTAAGGEINALDPGGYGPVTITKSITLDGAGTNASILAAGTNGIVVQAGAVDTVIIRNIEINGVNGSPSPGLNGIRFLSGGQLHVENVNIYGMGQQGVSFAPSAASQLFMRNCSLRDNTAGGVHVVPTGTGTATVALTNVALDGNGRGLRAEDGSTVVVRDSHAAGNVANGFVAMASSRAVDMTLENVVSAGNGATGIYAGPFATVRLSNTLTTKNNAGWQSAGGTIVSFGNNRLLDNASYNGPATVTVGQQ